MRKLLLVLCALAIAGAANARPYPAQTDISAAADSASVASTNPAAMTRFDSRNVRVERCFGFSRTIPGKAISVRQADSI